MKRIKKLISLFVLTLAFAASTVCGLVFASAAVSDTEYFLNGGFEGTFTGWEASGGTHVLYNKTDYPDDIHSGEKALKINGVWTRFVLNEGEQMSFFKMGQFYKYSAYVKSLVEADQQFSTEMVVWGSDGGSNWANDRASILPWTAPFSSEDGWQFFETTFAFYAEGGKMYSCINGTSAELGALSGKTELPRLAFEIGSTGNVDFVVDDLSLKETTSLRNATIRLMDGATAVEGATLTVKDSAGNALATQPQVTYADGVYTVSGLEFANVADQYKITAVKDGKTLTQQDIVVTYTNTSFEISTSSYTATVNVEDEQGNAVTDAAVTANVGGNPVSATNVGDGSYTFELFTAAEITVSKDGYLNAFASVSSANTTADIVLKIPKTPVSYQDNIVPNPSVESGYDAGVLTMTGSAEFSLTNLDQYDGERCLLIRGTGAADATGGLMYRVPVSAFKVDGTNYYLQVRAKAATEGATLSIGYILPCKTQDSWTHPQVLSEAVTLTDEWQTVSVLVAFRFDEINKAGYTSVNGEEEVKHEGDIISVEACDLLFQVTGSSAVYLDEFAYFETYDANVQIMQENGQYASEATFKLVDFDGTEKEVQTKFDAETSTFVFEDLKGVVKLIASVGDKTYPALTLSKTNKTATIEEGYNITLTLKDEQGNLVSGAKVIARKGVTQVGEFTDNGDGTYTLNDVMGAVSIVITKEGYTFTRQDNVTAANATLTVTGTNDNYVPETPGGDKGDETKGGCSGIVGGSAIAAAATMLVLAGGIMFKKRKDVQ